MRIEAQEETTEALEEILAAEEAAVSEETSAAQERCTKQHAQNADRNAKCLSSQKKEEMYSAKNAMQRKDLSTDP